MGTAPHPGPFPPAGEGEKGATAASGVPAVLLPYQAAIVEATQSVVIVEKGRRTGATWGVGALAAMTSAADKPSGGMDTLYMGTSQDMAREFIDAVAMWVRALYGVAAAVQDTEVEELLGDERRAIKAFRIDLPSGFEILALSARPRSLRGRQGLVVLDEAAFMDDLPETLKAALALLVWGGRVVVISTHNGAENPFAELVQDAREGRRPHRVIRIPFREAVTAGLYRRICLVRGTPWSQAAEDAWVADIYHQYGEGAAEELDCIPRRSGGAYLSRELIEACMTEPPGGRPPEGGPAVARLACPEGFDLRPLPEREAHVARWLDDQVAPALARLDPALRTSIGEDFGRSVDLTVLAVGQERRDLVLDVPLVVELARCPLAQQQQVLTAIVAAIARLGAIHMDATGNGLGLAEWAAERWGHSRVEGVKISDAWYLETAPRLKARLEDRLIRLPRDADIRDDLRAMRVVNGVPKIPRDARQRGRHGDAAVALLMLDAASRAETWEAGYETAQPLRRRVDDGSGGGRGDDGSDDGGNDDDRNGGRRPAASLGLALRGSW